MRAVPKHCRIVEEDLGEKHGFAFSVLCPKLRLSPGWKNVGRIQLHREKIRGRVLYAVRGIVVDPLHRRKGFATLLYEAAAQEACRRRGRLASTERNTGAHSEDFWRKQIAKGRATRFKRRSFGYGVFDDTIVLDRCPPPDIDLSGLSPKHMFKHPLKGRKL